MGGNQLRVSGVRSLGREDFQGGAGVLLCPGQRACFVSVFRVSDIALNWESGRQHPGLQSSWSSQVQGSERSGGQATGQPWSL